MTGISHELKPSVLRVSPGEQVVTAAVLLKLGCGPGPWEGTPVAGHPLDPLDAGEIRVAVDILRRERLVTPGARFVSVSLNEPAKDQVAFALPVGCSAPPAAAVVRA
jgi:Cu2+-containing amine oxidase